MPVSSSWIPLSFSLLFLPYVLYSNFSSIEAAGEGVSCPLRMLVVQLQIETKAQKISKLSGGQGN